MGGEYDREAEEAYKELAIRIDAETKKRVVKLQVSRDVALGLSLVSLSPFFCLSHNEVLLSTGPCCVHKAVHVRRRSPCRDIPRRKSVEWMKGADDAYIFLPELSHSLSRTFSTDRRGQLRLSEPQGVRCRAWTR